MGFSSDKPLLSNQLPLSIDFPQEAQVLSETLETTYKRIVNAINEKEGSLFPLQEVANFNSYFKYTSTVTLTPDPNNFRNGYRTTFDLVKLNGGAIGAGVTNIPLTATTTPPLINGILYPTRGYGGATIAGPIYIFVNDPQLYVRFNNTVPGAQVIIVTNNTGVAVTQFYWVMEYLKSN